MDKTHSHPTLMLTDRPIVNGDLFQDDAGTTHVADTTNMTITAADGHTHTIALQHHHGAWWAPKAANEQAQPTTSSSRAATQPGN